MAHELKLDWKLARHRGALLAGLEPRRLLPLVIPGAGRPADVVSRARHAECTSVLLARTFGRNQCGAPPRAPRVPAALDPRE